MGGDEGQSLVTVLRLFSQRLVWKDLCSLAYKSSGHMWLPPSPVFLTSVEPPRSVPTLGPWFGWRALILLGKLVWAGGRGWSREVRLAFQELFSGASTAAPGLTLPCSKCLSSSSRLARACSHGA